MTSKAFQQATHLGANQLSFPVAPPASTDQAMGLADPGDDTLVWISPTGSVATVSFSEPAAPEIGDVWVASNAFGSYPADLLGYTIKVFSGIVWLNIAPSVWVDTIGADRKVGDWLLDTDPDAVDAYRPNLEIPGGVEEPIATRLWAEWRAQALVDVLEAGAMADADALKAGLADNNTLTGANVFRMPIGETNPSNGLVRVRGRLGEPADDKILVVENGTTSPGDDDSRRFWVEREGATVVNDRFVVDDSSANGVGKTVEPDDVVRISGKSSGDGALMSIGYYNSTFARFTRGRQLILNNLNTGNTTPLAVANLDDTARNMIEVKDGAVVTIGLNDDGTVSLKSGLFAPVSQPSGPSEGKLYQDATAHRLRLYDGTEWKDVAHVDDIHAPYVPPARDEGGAVSAYNDSGGTTTIANGDVIPCNVENFDVSDEFDTVSGLFTADKAGIYHVVGNAYADSSSASRWSLQIDDSGAVYSAMIRGGQFNETTGWCRLAVSGMVMLKVGETVRVRADRISGSGTLDVNHDASKILITYIGPLPTALE